MVGSRYPDVVAVCEKCGREFVSIGTNWKMIDVYPANKKDSTPCGGQIVEVHHARQGPA